MQTTIQYAGDENILALMSVLGIQKTLPEIKAYLMRVIWGSRVHLPVEVLGNLLGPDREFIESETNVIEQFREQILALWHDLTRHMDPESPFTFEKFSAANSIGSLVERVKCRVREVQVLLPLLDDDIASLAKSSSEDMPKIKQNIIGSLERLTAVLDLLSEGAEMVLANTETLLQEIDTSLEREFNRLGQLHSQPRVPSSRTGFAILGSSGQA